jgi:hypothetical protein
LWHGDDNGVLVALGPRLAEIPFTLSSPRESSSSSYVSEEFTHSDRRTSKSNEQIRAEWQDTQVKCLVDEAKETSGNCNNLSGNTSECQSSIQSPREDYLVEKQMQIPEFQLNLNEFDKSTFKKPQFPRSALDVINFR